MEECELYQKLFIFKAGKCEAIDPLERGSEDVLH